VRELLTDVRTDELEGIVKRFQDSPYHEEEAELGPVRELLTDVRTDELEGIVKRFQDSPYHEEEAELGPVRELLVDVRADRSSAEHTRPGSRGRFPARIFQAAV